MQLRTKSYEQVSEWMSLKRETPEPIEQRDAGTSGTLIRVALSCESASWRFSSLFDRSDVNCIRLLPIHILWKYPLAFVLDLRGVDWGLACFCCRADPQKDTEIIGVVCHLKSSFLCRVVLDIVY